MSAKAVKIPERGKAVTEVVTEIVPHGIDVRVSLRALNPAFRECSDSQRLLLGLGAIANALLDNGVSLETIHRKLDTLPPIVRVERPNEGDGPGLDRAAP